MSLSESRPARQLPSTGDTAGSPESAGAVAEGLDVSFDAAAVRQLADATGPALITVFDISIFNFCGGGCRVPNLAPTGDW